MTVIIGKLTRLNYKNEADDFRIYSARASGGKTFSAIFNGPNGPKPLKTVEYTLFGEWEANRAHGKRFVIQKAERFVPVTSAERDQARSLKLATQAVGDVLTPPTE